VPLPGPNAITTALSASGLPTDRFVFLGFLPRQDQRRDEALAGRRFEGATLVYFEAPHRIVASLRAMAATWGERRVTVARSLTKPFEEFLRGTLSEVADRFAAEDRVLGELTVVVEGFQGPDEEAHRALADAMVAQLVAADVSPAVVRDTVSAVFSLHRRDVYQMALSLREQD
jgi:16S rRNA (cytidine1402-2'-O)-methyltransferase